MVKKMKRIEKINPKTSNFIRVALNLQTNKRKTGIAVIVPFDTYEDMDFFCKLGEEEVSGKKIKTLKFRNVHLVGDVLLIEKKDYIRLMQKSNKLRMIDKIMGVKR
jgi:hypothetical protein